MKLIDKAEALITQPAEFGFGKARQTLPGNPDFATADMIKAAQQMHQRRLARPGSTEDSVAFAGSNGEIDTPEHFHIKLSLAESLAHSTGFDYRSGLLMLLLIVTHSARLRLVGCAMRVRRGIALPQSIYRKTTAKS